MGRFSQLSLEGHLVVFEVVNIPVDLGVPVVANHLADIVKIPLANHLGLRKDLAVGVTVFIGPLQIIKSLNLTLSTKFC
jgi:hypothetical protein